MGASGSIADRLRNTFGWLCLAASLLLLSPGVQTVRADAEDAPKRPEAAEARPGEARERGAIPSGPNGPAGTPSRVSRPGPVGPKHVIQLNTRGYNYGPDRPTVELDSVRASSELAAPPASLDPEPPVPSKPAR